MTNPNGLKGLHPRTTLQKDGKTPKFELMYYDEKGGIPIYEFPNWEAAHAHAIAMVSLLRWQDVKR